MSVEAPPAPAAHAMEGIIESTDVPKSDGEPATTETAPAVETSETLYIQNLNEKIKPDSECNILLVGIY
jgi:hypothetical protein